MGRVTNFYGCLVLRHGKLTHEDLWVRDGVIVDPKDVQYTADISIDCKGAIIAPSFIDIKVNGVLGTHFSDPSHLTTERLNKVRAYLPYTGVTLFCPTVETSKPEEYAEIIPKLKKCEATPENGAGILGAHLDGPFISLDGAHDSKLRQTFGEDPGRKLKAVYGHDIDNVAIVTLAPDLENSGEAIRNLTRLGVKVSIGHTKAHIDVAEQAVRDGATMISHLFNAMPDFHHRDPGVVGLAVSKMVPQKVMYTIISDRYHVHPAALRLAYSMAPESLMLCTDGQAPLGLGPGLYKYDGVELEVKEEQGMSVCYKAADRMLYGSVCPFHRAVRNLQQITGCALEYALEAGSKRPAQLMGLYPQKGSLCYGSDADFVILEPGNLNLHACFIAGKKVADNFINPDLGELPLTCTAPDYYSPSLKRNSLPESSERLTGKRRKSVDGQ